MTHHLSHYYYKFIILGICAGLTCTFLVVYANEGESSQIPPLVDEVTDSNPVSEAVGIPETSLVPVSSTDTTDEAVIPDSDTLPPSDPVSTTTPNTSLIPASSTDETIVVNTVAEDKVAEITLDSVVAITIPEATGTTTTESTAAIEEVPSIATSTTTTSEVIMPNTEVLREDDLPLPEDPRECLTGIWRTMFSSPGECMRSVRDGVFRR